MYVDVEDFFILGNEHTLLLILSFISRFRKKEKKNGAYERRKFVNHAEKSWWNEERIKNYFPIILTFFFPLSLKKVVKAAYARKYLIQGFNMHCAQLQWKNLFFLRNEGNTSH